MPQQELSLQKLACGPGPWSTALGSSPPPFPPSRGSVLGAVPRRDLPVRGQRPPRLLPAASPSLGTSRRPPPLSPALAPLPQDALDGLMLEGENIVAAARKAIIRHDFSAVLTVFPILRHLKQTKPEFDQVLQVCG